MAKRKKAVAVSDLSHSFPPAELLQCIKANAERDAEAVAEFLRRFFSMAGTGKPPIKLSAAFLVGLGFALRLVTWEDQGHRIHLEEGLPPALDVTRNVIQLAAAGAALKSERESAFIELVARVQHLSIHRFAWEAPSILGSQMVLGEVDEQALVDALARFVWDRRHQPSSL